MLKPLPRLLLIVAAVGGAIYGINSFATSHGGLRNMFSKTATPGAIDVPTASTMQENASAGDTLNIAPAQGNYAARVLVLPWNAEAAMHYANGDVATAPGSLM